MHTPSVVAAASLFLLLLAPACKSKSESNDKPSAPPPTATKGTVEKVATPAPKPKPEPGPVLPPDAAIDCDGLLSAADVKKACGADLTWKKDVMEQGKGPTYCSRRGGPNGSFVRVMLGIYPHTEAATMVAKGAGVTSPGIEKRRAGRASLTVAHVRKHNIAASVRTRHLGDKTPLCTEAQLKDLAKLVGSRLP